MKQNSITKSQASIVALQMLKHKEDKVKALKQDAESILFSIYQGKIPTVVLDTFKKFPQYFKTTAAVHFSGNPYEYHRIGGRLPDVCEAIKVSRSEYELYRKALDKYEDANKEYKEVLNELTAAIYGARTIKKCHEILPESAKYLKENFPVPALNLSELRAKIK